MRIISLAGLCFSFILLSGCSSPEAEYEAHLETIHHVAEDKVERLEQHIDRGLVRNTKILSSYAEKLKKQKPEYKDIIDVLALDATTQGPSYQALVSRTKEAKQEIPRAKLTVEGYNELAEEIQYINGAASKEDYNLMLTDPINVLADMSDGTLARVSTESKDKTLKQKGAKYLGTGEQLVGNPHYGQWRSDSSGNSFWAWYGKYAFFSSFFSSPVRYSYWSRHRNYSYYHDYGRDYYSSSRQKREYSNTETRVRKKFQQQGKSFQSPYAKTKFGAKHKSKSLVKSPSKFGSASKYNTASKTSASKFSSPYSKTSSSKSSYNSRPSSSSRSSGFGGK